MGTVQNLHKINPIKRQIVNDIVNEIKSYEHVSQVVIFGSSIRNDCRAKSDLDIALKWDENCFDEDWVFKPFTLPIFKMIYKYTDGNADIIPIGYEGELQKAIKEGVVVYERSTPMISEESIMLARQAHLEQQRYGHVIVTCPKCHQHPKVTMTSRGERLTISCPCRYVLSGEIYF
jgi:hypothetical protein